MPVMIRDSAIHGRGVFAASDFLKGDVVMKWDASVLLTQKEADRVRGKDRKYLVEYNGRYIVSQPPERFLNHSCEPNTREGKLCDIALRDIKKGEELTTDYSTDSPQEKMKCNCGKKSCRKRI